MKTFSFKRNYFQRLWDRLNSFRSINISGGPGASERISTESIAVILHYEVMSVLRNGTPSGYVIKSNNKTCADDAGKTLILKELNDVENFLLGLAEKDYPNELAKRNFVALPFYHELIHDGIRQAKLYDAIPGLKDLTPTTRKY